MVGGIVVVGVVVGGVLDQNSVECHFWNTDAVASPEEQRQ